MDDVFKIHQVQRDPRPDHKAKMLIKQSHKNEQSARSENKMGWKQTNKQKQVTYGSNDIPNHSVHLEKAEDDYFFDSCGEEGEVESCSNESSRLVSSIADDEEESTPKKLKRVLSSWWTTTENFETVTMHSSNIDELTTDNKEQEEQEKYDVTLFWRLLGFTSHPIQNNYKQKNISNQTLTNPRNNQAADMRLSMLSNFSTSYNIICISLALDEMTQLANNSSSASITAPTHIDKSLCSSSLLVGMILGQIIFGVFGDLIGRHRAMVVVMMLQVIGSLSSAFSFTPNFSLGSNFNWILPNLNVIDLYQFLAVSRFILGLGCGGVYPLSATLTAESSSSKENRAKLVALTFSMQGVGYLFVPIVNLILIYILSNDFVNNTLHLRKDLMWRLLLGIGCLPGILIMVIRLSGRLIKNMKPNQHYHQDIEVDNEAQISQNIFQTVPIAKVQEEKKGKGNEENNTTCRSSIKDAIMTEDNIVQKFLGTGGTWFIFDVLFYGNTLFQPMVLNAAFSSESEDQTTTLAQTTFYVLILALISLPGYVATIRAIGLVSPRYIQMQGFLAMAILYFVIGLNFYSLSKFWLITLYGLTFLFSNFGPNSTTFVLPSMTFSQECRSTLNGVSAGCGKIGAVLGALLFAPASAIYGDDKVMLICSVLSILGFLLTFFFVQEKVGLGTTEGFDSKSTSDEFDIEKKSKVMDVGDREYYEELMHQKRVQSKASFLDIN